MRWKVGAGRWRVCRVLLPSALEVTNLGSEEVVGSHSGTRVRRTAGHGTSSGIRQPAVSLDSQTGLDLFEPVSRRYRSPGVRSDPRPSGSRHRDGRRLPLSDGAGMSPNSAARTAAHRNLPGAQHRQDERSCRVGVSLRFWAHPGHVCLRAGGASRHQTDLPPDLMRFSPGMFLIWIRLSDWPRLSASGYSLPSGRLTPSAFRISCCRVSGRGNRVTVVFSSIS